MRLPTHLGSPDRTAGTARPARHGTAKMRQSNTAPCRLDMPTPRVVPVIGMGTSQTLDTDDLHAAGAVIDAATGDGRQITIDGMSECSLT